MKLAYIRCPFHPLDAWQHAINIYNDGTLALAMHVAVALGVMPVTPHPILAHTVGSITPTFWPEGARALMLKCDILVCTSAWKDCFNTIADIHAAIRTGIPVITPAGDGFVLICSTDGALREASTLTVDEVKKFIL